MIKEYLKRKAYKRKLLDSALKLVEEQEKRRQAYEQLVNADLNYTILKDMVNQAIHNVVIEVTLHDGSKIVIRREEAFDQLNKIRAEEMGLDRRQSW